MHQQSAWPCCRSGSEYQSLMRYFTLRQLASIQLLMFRDARRIV